MDSQSKAYQGDLLSKTSVPSERKPRDFYKANAQRQDGASKVPNEVHFPLDKQKLAKPLNSQKLGKRIEPIQKDARAKVGKLGGGQEEDKAVEREKDAPPHILDKAPSRMIIVGPKQAPDLLSTPPNDADTLN